MASDHFSFKKFSIRQGKSAFKVGTDGVLLGAFASVGEAGTVLDIGSGTGLIALMIAQRSNAFVTAIEPDEDSFSDLVENAKNCPWTDKIRTLNVRLQDFVSTERFDLIVSNPPFFNNSLRNPDLKRSLARHNDSLKNSELLSGVSMLLNDEGIFQVILPLKEGNILVGEALSHGLFLNGIMKIRPVTGSEISRVILTFGKTKKPLRESSLTISTSQRHEYTEEYKDLTKDFYLNF